MISVSALAQQVLWESLQESGIPPEVGLRLTEGDQGLELEAGSPTVRDRVIRHQGAAIIIIDGELEDRIGNARVDVELQDGRPQLVIRRTPSQETSGAVEVSRTPLEDGDQNNQGIRR